MLDLEDDGDIGFESQDKFTKHVKKAFEVDFTVHSPEDITRFQEREVNEVLDLLGQSPESTAILLRYFRWNREKLIEQYMDHQEHVLEVAGLGETESNNGRIQSVSNFMCDICCNDEPGMQTFAMKCDHRFCVDCYRTYLTSKIKDEGEAARIKCPGDDCNRIVDSKSLDMLVSADLKQR
jgi:ariadne-1